MFVFGIRPWDGTKLNPREGMDRDREEGVYGMGETFPSLPQDVFCRISA